MRIFVANYFNRCGGNIFFFIIVLKLIYIYVPKSGFYIIRYIKTKPE